MAEGPATQEQDWQSAAAGQTRTLGRRLRVTAIGFLDRIGAQAAPPVPEPSIDNYA